LKSFKDKRIIIIDNKKNKGRPASVNEGINQTKGKIIVITDADCIAPKNWLHNIKKEFDSNSQLDAVGGVYETIGKDSISLAGNLLERIFMDFGLIPNALPGANSAYKKDALLELGGYPLRKWGADSFLNMLMREKKKKVKISPKIVIKTIYPKKLKPILKRKFYWGGGLAKTMDKMKFSLGSFIRPVYFTLLLTSLLTALFGWLFNSQAFLLGSVLFLAILILPGIAMMLLGFVWIFKENQIEYVKALPLMLILPIVQEASYFAGFMYVLSGGNLNNVWRQNKSKKNKKDIWEQRAEKDHADVMYSSKNNIFNKNINKLKNYAAHWANKHKGRKLLEIGCGDGIITQEFKQKDIFAFDISEKRIQRAKKRAKGTFFIANAEKQLDFDDNTFDIIVAINVIEYLKNPEKMLKEARRILNTNGILILSFPNKYVIGNLFYKDEVDFKRFSRGNIHKILNKLNLKSIHTKKIGFGAPNWRIFSKFQVLEKVLPKQYLMLIKK